MREEVAAWVLEVPEAGVASLPGLCLLDVAERERMAAFVHEADRVQYAFAHIALRKALGDWLGMAPAKLSFAREACPCCGGPHGRPILAASSAAPVEFSLSHGGRMVAIALARVAVGVDVEPVPDEQVATKVSARLHPDERAEIEACEVPERAARFTRLWARKEAYLKALGTGLGRDLSVDDCRQDFPGWCIADLEVAADHRGAVAVRSDSGCQVRQHCSL
ncbi:4'-phosphopantetheinyl transferase superfamily protein (plasmid) [Streptomyces sp. NBC_01136]|uniref:4'-phosphopantetheinyl transferase family protein n=1 Tax=unclassified Streptomyces TaxID=2593676 RepID=UPI00325466A3|nr:4'-phosphopantetheinyl transferase superfamily protein [Streptomyces sp. NBC_01136]